MKISLVFFLTISSLTYGQDVNQFETFNDLLNAPLNEVEHRLKQEFGVKGTERMVKSSDSVRLIFRSRKPKRTFTFFVVNDTLRYIGVTLFKVTTAELRDRLSTQYAKKSLTELKGDIFENYTNEIHIADTFFSTKEGSLGYLSVVYPKLGPKHSHFIVWRRLVR